MTETKDWEVIRFEENLSRITKEIDKNDDEILENSKQTSSRAKKVFIWSG